jgi:hypothetical protein
MKLSLSAEKVLFEDDTPGVSVKLQGEQYEINIWFTLGEIEKLNSTKNTLWEKGSIKAGKSANSNVFWSHDNGIVAILIGEDDEVWDFGVFIPLNKFEEMLNEIKKVT